MRNKRQIQMRLPSVTHIYLVTKLDGITDNVTKIQRQSSAKFYNLMNQNRVITCSNKIKI